MRIRSSAKRATYTAGFLIDGGGVAIPNDPSPNTVTLASLVAAGRVFAYPKVFFNVPGGFITSSAADGTSCSARGWFYDDVEALWIPTGAEQNMTTAGANQAITFGFAGPKWYVQITNNTTVTKVSVLLR